MAASPGHGRCAGTCGDARGTITCGFLVAQSAGAARVTPAPMPASAPPRPYNSPRLAGWLVRGGATGAAGDYSLAGWYSWSNKPPSAKWTFCALVQPPAISSIVNSLIFGNWAAYLLASFSTVGR